MKPQILKYRLWRMAQRMNPQTATYNAITLGSVPGAANTPTPYNLLRLTYEEPEANELAMAGATLQDSFQVWRIYQVDLDQAQAPTPVTGYSLTFSDGTTWEIRNVKAEAMKQAFRCLCSQARPQ